MPSATYTGNANKPVYVSGIVQADKNFTYNSTDLQFDPGFAGFDVGTNRTLNLKLNTTARGVQGSSCNELWRGFGLIGSAKLICSNVIIRDALYGIKLSTFNGVTTVKLEDVQFVENYIGIHASRRFGIFEMKRTIFDGGTSLRQAGVLLSQANSSIVLQSTNPFDPGYTNAAFNNTRGFVGIYSAGAALTLPPLPIIDINTFKNLNLGIVIRDADLSIRQNAQFFDLSKGGYTNPWVSAITFHDTKIPGNRLLVEGTNGGNTFGADMNNIPQGILLRTSNTPESSPTQVKISNMTMKQVKIGIYLDQREMGTILGNQGNGIYTGINNNHIEATLFVNGLDFGGIITSDGSVTKSNIEIFNNFVRIDYDEPDSGLNTNWSGAIGCKNTPLALPSPVNYEVDIHDNRVEITGTGESGIGLQYAGYINVRNNSGGSLSGGNGIFINTNNLVPLGAIVDINGLYNRIRCNHVESSTSAHPENKLLQVLESSNLQIQRNLFRGKGRGAYFEGFCNGTSFRCNNLEQNDIGLYYVDDAVTEVQGGETDVTGNVWMGNFSEFQAFIEDEFDVINNQYYVRNLTTPTQTEKPSITNTNFNWFRTPVSFPSGGTPNCIITDCPANPGLVEPPVVTTLDTVIATNISSLFYSDAEKWSLQFNLYRKLSDYPAILAGNTVMNNYFNSMAGSPIANFIQIQKNTRTGFSISPVLVQQIQDKSTLMNTYQEESNALEESVVLTLDPAVIDNLTVLLSQKYELLNNIQDEFDVLSEQVKGEITSAAAGYMASVNSISTTNLFEDNYKATFLAYLSAIPGATNWNLFTQNQIKSIAEQCPNQGGLGVWSARSVYNLLGGRDLNLSDCSNVEEREDIEKKDLETARIKVSPNPTSGVLQVSVPNIYSNKKAVFSVVSILGVVVQTESLVINGSNHNLDLSLLPSGIYYVNIQIEGERAESIRVILK